jgi:DNA-binding MarR family transcriptional regulator
MDRLVVMGLVDRHEDEHDRRIKVLQLTAAGKKLLETIISEMPEALGCTNLPASERLAMHQIAAHLI